MKKTTRKKTVKKSAPKKAAVKKAAVKKAAVKKAAPKKAAVKIYTDKDFAKNTSVTLDANEMAIICNALEAFKETILYKSLVPISRAVYSKTKKGFTDQAKK